MTFFARGSIYLKLETQASGGVGYVSLTPVESSKDTVGMCFDDIVRIL